MRPQRLLRLVLRVRVESEQTGMNIASIIVLASVVGQATSPATDVGPVAATPRPVVRRPDARMAMTLPPTITGEDLKRYGDYLQLAAPQQLFLMNAHARYMAAVSSILDKAMPELDAHNAYASTLVFRDGITGAMVAATDQFYDKQDEVSRAISQADGVLFSELTSILSESQRELMPRVADHRQRRRCCAMAYRVIRSSTVDLSAWVEEMVTDAELLVSLDPVLAEYERALTPLTVRLEAEMRTQDRLLPALLVWMQRDEMDRRLNQDEMRERERTGIVRQRDILAEGVALQTAIARLNTKTLPLLLAGLPNERATALAERFRRAVYPEIYMSQETAFGLCDAALSSDALTAAQREALSAICIAYRTSYDALSIDMERRCDRWKEFYAATRFTMDQYEPYKADMRALRQKRWELGLTLIRQLQSIVPQTTVPIVDQEVAALRMLIDQRLAESNTPQDRFPGI